MPNKIYATNILDFVLDKRAQLLHLPTKQAAIYSVSKELTKTANISPSAAVFVIDQQSSVISGLQRALNESMKVAAALAEAATLAKDGMIDSSDVIDHARRALVDGNVKVSSVNDIFDQSPGRIVSGNASNQPMDKAAKLDPLTSQLRSLTS